MRCGRGDDGLCVSCPLWAQVVCSRLGEMDVLIHRLLDVQVDLETPQDTSPQADSILPALSLLMKQFTQVSD